MKNSTTFVLKGVLLTLGAAVLAGCGFLLYILVAKGAGDYSPVFIGMFIASLPFYLGLAKAWKLLTNIDKDEAFSESSIIALKYIKYSAGTISCLYVLLSPFIFIAADRDDAPGVILIGLIIIFASFVVSVFAAVLEKLLQKGMEIKSENDLTV